MDSNATSATYRRTADQSEAGGAEAREVEARVGSRAAAAARALGGALACGAVAASLGCGGGGSTPASNTPGGVNTQGVEFFFEDPHSDGRATQLLLSNVFHGRLVEVVGLDAMGVRIAMAEDFVIETALANQPGNFFLETNAETGQQTLVVQRDVTDLTAGGGRDQFFDLLRSASDGLTSMRVADVSTSGVFTMVPRNSAMVLQFSDLVDPRTIDPTTIRLHSGYPPTTPFEGRLIVDLHHGGMAEFDGLPGLEYYPTRVILDTTISELEAFTSVPPQPINSLGMPASVDSNRANMRYELPTVRNIAAGQARVLSNPSNHPLATTGNGPVNFAHPAQPILRAFRSGGLPSATSDPFNGFMFDQRPPQVVGSNLIELLDAPQLVSGERFLLPRVEFASQLCAQTPKIGDVIVQSGVFAEVVVDAAPVLGTLATNVQVRLLQFPAAWTMGPAEWEVFGLGEATFNSAYDPTDDVGREACFITVTPRPTGYPDQPTTGIDTNATFRVRFTEAMDPASLTAFDSLTLTRSPVPAVGNPSTDQFVIGRVGQSVDLREFSFEPDLPLNHVLGTAESYFLAIADGTFAPTDLAANVLSTFDQVELTVDPAETQQLNGGNVSRFVNIDEQFPVDNGAWPEWGGQLLVDVGRQVILPRPVVRSQVIIDREQPTLQGHTPFSLGIVTPLSNYGSKMQTLWRYADCGFSINDGTSLNIDVEGMGWAPAGGALVADAFSEFEIRLSHSKWAPDEVINPASLFPSYPTSGLEAAYTNNILQTTTQSVVHPRASGYIINPADIFVAPSGTRIMPFPLNRDVPLTERRTYTWRDTSIRQRAGTLNGGVDPAAYLLALGLPVPTPPNNFYPPNEVQTAGLPLLLEFRTYPDSSAGGINGFDINLAANSSSMPYFRAFSTGGIRTNGATRLVDPDTETTANGGFNPGSLPLPGATTYGRDNSVYLGSLDLVVRVSMAHSVWFQSIIQGEPSFGGRTYLPPTLEPRAEDQPEGTSIEVNFRGASAISYFPTPPPGQPAAIDNDSGDPNPTGPAGEEYTDFQINAFTIDLYGDYYNDVDPPNRVHRASNANPGITFLQGNNSWRTNVSDITGAAFYQVRLTFLANIATGESPELSAFGLSWTR